MRLHDIYELKKKNIYAGKDVKKLLYAKKNEDGDMCYYDGEEIFKDDGEIFRAAKYGFSKKNCEKSKYIIMNECLYCKYATKKNKRVPHKSIKECYDHSKDVYDYIKKGTGNKIDMTITGDMSTTIMKRLMQKMEHVVDLNKPKKVDTRREYAWMKDATVGPLIYAIPRSSSESFSGFVQVWDINSCHCSILRDENFKFPIECGEYRTITKISEKVKFGIYRAVISFENTHINNFRFRINEDNKYTHIDIEQARRYGYDIKLIDDGNPNFLYYNKDKLFTGSCLRGYIDEIYGYKEECTDLDVKAYYKQMLSALWGYLTEERFITSYVKKGELYDKDIRDDDEVSREYFNDEKDKITIFNYSDPYKTRFARVKPFLMAHVRKSLSDIYEHVIDRVVRVHTDGFYIKASKEDAPLFKETRDIGGVKLEYVGHVEMKNVNKIKKIGL